MWLSVAILILTLSGPCKSQYHSNRLWTGGHYNVTQSTPSCITSTDLRRVTEEAVRSVLEEILGPGKINDRLHNLESQMADQFNIIKTIVLNTESKVLKQNQLWQTQHRQLKQMISVSGPASNIGSDTNEMQKHWEISHVNEDGKTEAVDDGEGDFFLDDYDKQKSSREEEINVHNNSVTVIRGKPVYRYYWRINNISYKISGWGVNRSERSPTFEVQPYGYNMYMRVVPKNNHLANNPMDYFSIHVGITQGLHDHQLEWPFKLKHRVTILDFSKPPGDLASRLWDPSTLCSAWNWKRPSLGDNHECVGLGVPIKELKTRKYLYKDSLVLRLSVIID